MIGKEKVRKLVKYEARNATMRRTSLMKETRSTFVIRRPIEIALTYNM